MRFLYLALIGIFLFGMLMLAWLTLPYASLPPGMYLANEIRVDTMVFRPTITRRWLDSATRANSLNACHDSARPRQRLDSEDIEWLKKK
jgi:hypothetical protein